MTAAERFLALGPRDVAESWLHDLEARYSEPHRHYHTRTHIEPMLELLPHPDETVMAAVWFHDAHLRRGSSRSHGLTVSESQGLRTSLLRVFE